MSKPKYKIGQEVTFTGYKFDDDLPDNHEALEEGTNYKILDITEDSDGCSYELVADADGKEVTVEVWEEEIEKAAAKSKAKSKAKAKGKGKAKVEAEEEVEAEAKTEEDNTDLSVDDDDDLADMVVLEEDQEDPEVLAAIKGTNSIIELAKQQAEDAAKEEWLLGGVLYHVRLDRGYKRLEDGKYAGKGGFRQFCEDVLNLDYRKALDLCGIYARFSQLGLGASDLQEMGYSSAAALQTVLDEDNVEELVKYANTHTVREVRETAKANRAEAGNGKSKQVIKMTRFAFAVKEAEGKIIGNIMELARERTGITNDGELFAQICREWADDNLDRSALDKLNKSKAKPASQKAAAKQKAPAKTKAAAKQKAAPKAKAKPKTKAKAPAKKKAAAKRKAA